MLVKIISLLYLQIFCYMVHTHFHYWTCCKGGRRLPECGRSEIFDSKSTMWARSRRISCFWRLIILLVSIVSFLRPLELAEPPSWDSAIEVDDAPPPPFNFCCFRIVLIEVSRSWTCVRESFNSRRRSLISLMRYTFS